MAIERISTSTDSSLSQPTIWAVNSMTAWGRISHSDNSSDNVDTTDEAKSAANNNFKRSIGLLDLNKHHQAIEVVIHSLLEARYKQHRSIIT